MRRILGSMRFSVLIAILCLTGCSGLVDDGGSGGLTPDELTARKLWLSKALPLLKANCDSCHGGSMPGIDFIAGTSDLEVRDNLLAHEPSEVDLDSPSSSHLLTRGAHDGPALDASQLSDLLEWIRAEKQARGVATVIIGVAKFQAALCTSGLPDTPAAPNPNCLVNHAALDELGAPGATIDFVVQALSGATYITNLQVTPGASGVFVDHPLFVTYPATVDENRLGCGQDAAGETFCGDNLDRFSTVQTNLMTGDPPAVLGDGTATFAEFIPTDQMSIHFKEVGVYKP